MNSKIETHTGRLVDPFAMSADGVNVTDIAHALSNICRYGGHCSRHYSVAEHSLYVARWLEREGKSCDVVLAGLMHDASEAYLGDIPNPIKRSKQFKDVREADKTLMFVIAEVIGFPWPCEDVDEADFAVFACEAQVLTNGKGSWLSEKLYSDVLRISTSKPGRELIAMIRGGPFKDWTERSQTVVGRAFLGDYGRLVAARGAGRENGSC